MGEGEKLEELMRAFGVLMANAAEQSRCMPAWFLKCL